jgi:hypothetical protein
MTTENRTKDPEWKTRKQSYNMQRPVQEVQYRSYRKKKIKNKKLSIK